MSVKRVTSRCAALAKSHTQSKGSLLNLYTHNRVNSPTMRLFRQKAT